jgi:hypothetical protein
VLIVRGETMYLALLILVIVALTALLQILAGSRRQMPDGSILADEGEAAPPAGDPAT